jgi:hypothetical protein
VGVLLWAIDSAIAVQFTTGSKMTKTDTISPILSNVSTADVQLARAYFPLLVEAARQRQRVSYGDLVIRAKAAHPGVTVIQKAITVSTGRRLDVIRRFTNERGLPDLASVALTPGAGERTAGSRRSPEPEASRDTVFDFDWSPVDKEFGAFMKQAEAAAKHRKTVKEPIALAAMSAHFREHQATLPARVREQRLVIVEMIMEGFSAEEAFERALQDE